MEQKSDWLYVRALNFSHPYPTRKNNKTSIPELVQGIEWLRFHRESRREHNALILPNFFLFLLLKSHDPKMSMIFLSLYFFMEHAAYSLLSGVFQLDVILILNVVEYFLIILNVNDFLHLLSYFFEPDTAFVKDANLKVITERSKDTV